MHRLRVPKPRATFLAAGALLIAASGAEAQNSALTLGGAYTGDAFYNAAGGVDEGGGLLHNLDLTVGWDGELAFGISGLEAFLYLLANAGDSMVEYAGDSQVASNIEAPEAIRLYEMWIQKHWSEWSLLVGLYDLNGEFYVNEPAGLFLNSSHGVGPELASSGVTGPSIFPVTSLSVRVEWSPTPGTFARVAVLDAVPGDPADDARFVHLELGGGEGALIVGESGFTNETERRKVALGAWAYTTDFPDAVEAGVTHGKTYGAYVIGETRLGGIGGPDREVLGFARIGYADADVHPASLGWAAGLVHDRPLGAESARVGVGVSSVRFSQRYVQAREDDGDPVDRAEIAIEVTGSVSITDWLRVQPDAQYVLNPGMDPALDDALLLGIRMEVAF